MRALCWVTWCAGLDPLSHSPHVVHFFFFSSQGVSVSNPALVESCFSHSFLLITLILVACLVVRVPVMISENSSTFNSFTKWPKIKLNHFIQVYGWITSMADSS